MRYDDKNYILERPWRGAVNILKLQRVVGRCKTTVKGYWTSLGVTCWSNSRHCRVRPLYR